MDKHKFFKEVNKFKSDKVDLSVVSDLTQQINLLESKSREVETSSADLKNGYQDYFNALDTLIMESSFIIGMNNKVEGELAEAADLSFEAQNNIENLISKFDELGIDTPPEIANLIETFFELQNSVIQAEQSFNDMSNLRSEAEEVERTTSNKQLNF